MREDLQMTKGQRGIILAELEKVVEVHGDVVEMGCYAGDTSVEIGRALRRLGVQKKMWLYDSFEGLPEKSGADASAIGVNFKAGELKASKSEVITKFKKAGLDMPKIKKAWFDDLDQENDLPDQICFALLDGDYYDSIRVSLRLAVPKVADGGVIIVHDYQNEALPGARRAVDEFLRLNQSYSMQVRSGLAIIRKKYDRI